MQTRLLYPVGILRTDIHQGAISVFCMQACCRKHEHQKRMNTDMAVLMSSAEVYRLHQVAATFSLTCFDVLHVETMMASSKAPANGLCLLLCIVDQPAIAAFKALTIYLSVQCGLWIVQVLQLLCEETARLHHTGVSCHHLICSQVAKTHSNSPKLSPENNQLIPCPARLPSYQPQVAMLPTLLVVKCLAGSL